MFYYMRIYIYNLVACETGRIERSMLHSLKSQERMGALLLKFPLKGCSSRKLK
jgi:hypothetical protein